MIVSLNEMAGFIGISPRQVNKLAKAKVIPRAGKGRYDVAGVFQAYIAYVRDGDADKKTTLHEEQTRLIRVQRRKIELAIGEKEGRLIPDTEFQKFMERLIIAARTNILLIENEIPRIRASENNTEGKEIYRKSAYAVLEQLANADIVPSDEEDDEDDVEAVEPAPKSKHGRVGRRKNVVKS